LGTQADNVADKVQKNRQAKGTTHGMNKLKTSEVILIREKAGKGVQQSKIAREFGISQTHVMRIVKNKVWSHLLPLAENSNV
jgi:DNA-directed RNA polymerase specialized sigma subunit